MSWYQLDSILKEQSAYWQAYAASPPMACPNDGEPLQQGPPEHSGILFCPFDGWQYPRDYDPQLHNGM